MFIPVPLHKDEFTPAISGLLCNICGKQCYRNHVTVLASFGWDSPFDMADLDNKIHLCQGCFIEHIVNHMVIDSDATHEVKLPEGCVCEDGAFEVQTDFPAGDFPYTIYKCTGCGYQTVVAGSQLDQMIAEAKEDAVAFARLCTYLVATAEDTEALNLANDMVQDGYWTPKGGVRALYEEGLLHKA